MSDVAFTSADLVAALNVPEWEAEYLISGDLFLHETELIRLAKYKGISKTKVKKFFKMMDISAERYIAVALMYQRMMDR